MALDLGELVGYLKLDDKQFDTVLDKLPEKMRGKGALMLGAAGIVGAAVGAAVSSGVGNAISLEAANNKVAGQLGLTEAEAARVGSLAGQVYSDNFGESVEQVQQVVGQVVSAIQGMGTASDSTVEAMTAKVLNYASAFEVDTASAVAMVQQLMSSGLATSADEAMDLMTAAMQKVPEALRGDMSDAITEYGPLLAGMGFSGQEAFDLLAKGAEKGMYGIDKAGDAVKEFGIRATDMSETSKGAYDAIGMNQQDMTNRLLAGGDSAKAAFDEIVKGIMGIKDPAAQSQAALALFGTPLEDLGVSEIPAFLGSLTELGGGFADAAGSAEAMGEKMGGGAAASMETLNRQIETMLRGLGEDLLPVLTDVFGFMAENPAVLEAVAIALGILAAAFIGVSVATWIMNTALLANPITWIVLGIMALIGALVLLAMNWETVAAWVTEIWGGFTSWLTESVNGLQAWWNEVWAGFGAWISEIWTGFVGWVTEIWNGFTAWLTGSVNGIQAWWNSVWAAVGQFVQNTWSGFVSWITAIFLGYVSWLMGVGATLLGWWNGLWSGVANFARSIWAGIVAFFAMYIGSIVSTATARITPLVNFFSGIWNSISSGVTSAWNGITSFLGGVPGKIMGFFSGAATLLSGIGRNIVDGLLGGLKGAWDRVTGWISGAAQGVADTFARVLQIHSPSRVFRRFGQNTVEGYLLGVDDLGDELNSSMADIVQLPVSDVAVNARATGTGIGPDGGAPGAGAGVYVHAPMNVGNVGWDRDELERASADHLRDALTLAGVDEIGVV